MRISNRMMQLSTLAQIRAQQARLAEAERHAASGKRIERPSDAPVDASQAMLMQGQLETIDQYKRNATSATTRLATEETVLKAARDLISKARAIAMSVDATDPADPSRATALKEIATIQEQLVSLGNTRIGDERLFGGGDTNPPFQPDGTYVGGTYVHQTELDDNASMATGHTGVIFAATFQSLGALQTALQSGTPADIQATVKPLADAEEGLLANETESGARQQEIADAVTRLGARAQTILDRRQALTDADPAESLLKVQAATQSLEQAYAVTQRVLSLNIVDYLR
jgi:flagellar hook-associated protein 3 FlgL